MMKLCEVLTNKKELINPSIQNGLACCIELENIERDTGNLIGNPYKDFTSIKSSKLVFKKGDILFGKLWPNLNKVCIAESDGICSTDILVLVAKDDTLSMFYSSYMRSKLFNEIVLNTVKGQQLPRTSWDSIKDIQVPDYRCFDKEVLTDLSTITSDIEISRNNILRLKEKRENIYKNITCEKNKMSAIQEQIQPSALKIVEVKPLEPISHVMWKTRERIRDIEDQKVFDVMERIQNETTNT